MMIVVLILMDKKRKITWQPADHLDEFPLTCFAPVITIFTKKYLFVGVCEPEQTSVAAVDPDVRSASSSLYPGRPALVKNIERK